MTTKPNEAFLVLTEDEHENVCDLWRHQRGNGWCLPERYAHIHRAILPSVAARLGCADEQVPACYLDQIAHAVFACAIKEPELRGSMAGDLVEAIFYRSGGSHDLERYGRLCFCSAYWRKDPQPGALHPSSCDLLWEAYCRAMNAFLERKEALATDSLCMLDMTLVQRQDDERCHNRDLQRCLAAYLHLDEHVVQSSWATVGWLPTYGDGSAEGQDGSTYQTIRTEIEALHAWLRQRGKSISGQRFALIVDDPNTPATAVAAFALAIQKRAKDVPLIIGVEKTAERGWRVLESVPRPQEMVERHN